MTNTTFIKVGGAGGRVTTPASRREMLEAVKEAGDRLHSFHRDNREMLWERAPDIIAKAAQLFLEEDSIHRKRAIEHSSVASMSPAMMKEALKNFFSRFQREDMIALREKYLGDSKGRRASRPSESVKSIGEIHAGETPAPPLKSSVLPRVVFHVFAGNLFLSSLESLIHSSFCGACSLARCSSVDPLFPQLWTDAIAAIDPLFAKSLAVAWWPKEYEDSTRIVGELSDTTIAFGDDETVEKLRKLTDGASHFVAHGSKVSFAILPDGDWKNDMRKQAKALAYDFSVYDQAGCLSPRAAFIQTDSREFADKFADLLTKEMREIASLLPQHELSLEESAALARARNEALIEAAAGEKTNIKSRSDDPFLVRLRPSSDYHLSCTNRFCDLHTFSTDDELTRILSPFAGRISTVGLPGGASEFAVNAGTPYAYRVCSIGQMQRPPLDWFHDGNPPLTELLAK